LNYALLAYTGTVVVLLLLLVWLSSSRSRKPAEKELSLRQEREWRHISYLPQIKQALASSDYEFLSSRGPRGLAKRVKKERKRIAMKYLSALRTDFSRLLQFARVIAVMSPEVSIAQELQGFRLSLDFHFRYYLIYCRLLLGIAPLEALGSLSDMLSALTVRMEAAISELGERAALPTEMASP
jgi:hypothetical protein